ncbi:flavodoxin [Longilinea arvoryzae]|uniref:Flavodoxin n=1 Tax=Longilinea arvoryzae TaxID=360412 RepID=A0A0S7BNP5_9CHLR|nr:flavodoxin domain-containing protein [Longilinea arvoryzae]GAP15691.1 flavodoxin [Longilinea arvoryzae]
MNDKILVTYASKYGSTQEVAEAVAKTLREKGLNVELQRAAKVQTIEPYSAVVLGAPMYIGHFHGDARKFLARHQTALATHKTAFFALGPTEDNEKDWIETRKQFDQELANMPWFNPLARELFGGKMDPARFRFPDNLLTLLPASPLHNMPASDARNWDKIRAWAEGLAEQLI